MATHSRLQQLDVMEISGNYLNIEFSVTYPFPSQAIVLISKQHVAHFFLSTEQMSDT